MNVINHVKVLNFLEINASDRVFLYIKNDDNVKIINIKKILDNFTFLANEIMRTTYFKMTAVKLHYLKLNWFIKIKEII